jgi:hypothetical protein
MGKNATQFHGSGRLVQAAAAKKKRNYEVAYREGRHHDDPQGSGLADRN